MRQVLRSGRADLAPKVSTASGRVPHRKRPPVKDSLGVHVTWKLLPGVRSLRHKSVIEELDKCFRAAKERFDMCLFGYTVMDTHFHLIVGVRDSEALRKGLQGLGIRLAKAINRVFARKGKVFRDRFFARPLMTRSAARHAVNYALQNARKHGVAIPAGEWDPYSSARYINTGRGTNFSHVEVAERPVVLACSFTWPWIYVALKCLQPDFVPGRAVMTC